MVSGYRVRFLSLFIFVCIWFMFIFFCRSCFRTVRLLVSIMVWICFCRRLAFCS